MRRAPLFTPFSDGTPDAALTGPDSPFPPARMSGPPSLLSDAEMADLRAGVGAAEDLIAWARPGLVAFECAVALAGFIVAVPVLIPALRAVLP